MRLLLTALLALALAVLPFGMASMMGLRDDAQASMPHVSQIHGAHHAAPVQHGEQGRTDRQAPFAQCAAMQMTLPAAEATSHPVMAATAIRLPRLAGLEGRASDPSTPPPRG